MQYYARSANESNQKEPLTHHLRRVSELCEQFLEPIKQGKTGNLLGVLHDAGKHSQQFQQVLLRQGQHVNHAAPGAALALGIFSKRNQDAPPTVNIAKTMAIVIAAHHSRLEANATINLLKRVLQGEGEPYDSENNEIPIFGNQALKELAEELALELPELRNKPNAIPRPTADAPELSWMLLTRMLFSGLVDADYLASAEYFNEDVIAESTGPPLDAERALEKLFALREEKRKGAPRTLLNARRDQLFLDCLAAAAMLPGIFTLTAPTGLGKTLCLMAFALKHCILHHKRRIILVSPYLALTHQSVKDYRAVMPELIESHSAAEMTQNPRIFSERWSVPCIVTTTVGFFEPLFSDRPADCRRLHQLADSVIVLDEAQSLPASLLDSTLLCIRELTERYGCTFVFSTATQPSYQYRKGLQNRWKLTEIVPDSQSLFTELQRVAFDWRLSEPITPELLAAEVAAHEQVCVIVNTRALARKIFKEVAEMRSESGVYLMSTDLCAKHREELLHTVKQRLREGLPCLLIATQCVEAGVDFSFPIMYRALAPLESIIQAAGRCNRNGERPTGNVVVFRFPDDVTAYPKDTHYQYAAACVLKLHARHPIDCANLRHIDEYYSLVYPNDAGDRALLTEAIKGLDFETVHKQYRLIGTYGVQIVVPYDKAQFGQLREMSDRDGLTPAFIRLAGRLAVNTPMTDALSQVCTPILHRGQNSDQNTGWYMLVNEDWYTEQMGLAQEGTVESIY